MSTTNFEFLAIEEVKIVHDEVKVSNEATENKETNGELLK